jgi:hypothetical protein
MNEEINQNIVSSRPGGLGPVQNIAQQGGLGAVQAQSGNDGGYQRNSSLAMFELANAEKNKAKEMFYETEAMKAKAMQQNIGAERNAVMQQEQARIDGAVLAALENGKLDDMSVSQIFQDSRVSDDAKQKIADRMYPPRNVIIQDPAVQEMVDKNRDYNANLNSARNFNRKNSDFDDSEIGTFASPNGPVDAIFNEIDKSAANNYEDQHMDKDLANKYIANSGITSFARFEEDGRRWGRN